MASSRSKRRRRISHCTKRVFVVRGTAFYSYGTGSRLAGSPWPSRSGAGVVASSRGDAWPCLAEVDSAWRAHMSRWAKVQERQGLVRCGLEGDLEALASSARLQVCAGGRNGEITHRQSARTSPTLGLISSFIVENELLELLLLRPALELLRPRVYRDRRLDRHLDGPGLHSRVNCTHPIQRWRAHAPATCCPSW